VEVADTELKPPMPPPDGRVQTLWVRAFINCERESQKGMIVGKGGSLIKQIRVNSEKQLNEIFDWHVKLDLRVKTARDWRHDDATLKRLLDT
jgi:GTP-binding protein Era